MAAGPVPFVRRAYDSSRHTESLASMLRWRGDQAAQAAIRQGESSAQLWNNVGNIIGQAGQTIANIPRQRREEEQAKQATELRQMQLEEARATTARRAEEQAATKAYNDAMSGAIKQDADGFVTIDRERIINGLTGAGRAGDVPKALGVIETVEKAARESRTARREALGALAYGVHRDGNTAEAFGLGAAMAEMNGDVHNAQLQPFFDRINADPTPETVSQITTALIAGTSYEARLQKEAPTDYTLGDTRYSGRTNEALATNERPKTEDKPGSEADFIARAALRQGRPVASFNDREVGRLRSEYAAQTRAPNDDGPGGITQAQRATAARFKENELQQAEEDFRKATAQYTNPMINDIPTGQPVAIPQDVIDQHNARKRRIQLSYLEQIGDTSTGRPAALPNPPPAPTPPPVRAAVTPPTAAPAAPIGVGTASGASSYTVGQVVSVRGQRVRITKVNPDGSFEGERVVP